MYYKLVGMQTNYKYCISSNTLFSPRDYNYDKRLEKQAKILTESSNERRKFLKLEIFSMNNSRLFRGVIC